MELSQNPQDIERLEYELKREQFNWEKAKYHTWSGRLNRHFGVIITATVSVAAVVVSYVQLNISANSAKAQLDNETLKNDRQLRLETLKNDRQFYLEATKFLLDRQRQLTTQQTANVTFLRDVVVSVFPHDVATEIATRMRDSSKTNDVRTIWEEGLTALRSRKP